MKKENILSVGSIVASLFVVSCCIGCIAPSIFVIFGTSIGFLEKLALLMPLKPYLLAAAFLMLGYPFWKLYLKKTDCACVEDLPARKTAHKIFRVGFILLVFTASFQGVILWLY